MTLEEAILKTVVARRTVDTFSLPVFVQLRFKKLNEREPGERAVLSAFKKLVAEGKIVQRADKQYVLSDAKKKAPRKKATPLPKGRVYFFSPLADGFERAQKAVAKRFTVKGNAFRWNKGPELRLEEATRADAVKGARPSHRRWLSQHDVESVFCLAFDDLEAVLDEINTLIEAQVVISKAAKAPRFLAWNKTLMSVDDEVVKFQPR